MPWQSRGDEFAETTRSAATATGARRKRAPGLAAIIVFVVDVLLFRPLLIEPRQKLCDADSVCQHARNEKLVCERACQTSQGMKPVGRGPDVHTPAL